jgi:plasmid stability protein
VPTFTVKSIPEELYRRLKQNAAENRRSLNSEVIVCLERSLNGKRVNPEAVLARAGKLRRQLALPPLTESLLRAAKSGGRP